MLWFLLACLLVLPVVLRLLGGDDEPDNAITHESGDDPHGSREGEPDVLLTAA